MLSSLSFLLETAGDFVWALLGAWESLLDQLLHIVLFCSWCVSFLLLLCLPLVPPWWVSLSFPVVVSSASWQSRVDAPEGILDRFVCLPSSQLISVPFAFLVDECASSLFDRLMYVSFRSGAARDVAPVD